jgi:hypothetical protein
MPAESRRRRGRLSAAFVPLLAGAGLLRPAVGAAQPVPLRIEPPAEARAEGGEGSLWATLGADARRVVRTLERTAAHEVLPRDWGWGGYLLGLAGAAAYLEAHKEQIRRDVLQSGFARHSGWTDAGDQLGRSHTVEGLAAASYLAGLAARSPAWRDTGLLLAESTLVAQAGAGIVSFAVSETRPRRGGVVRYFHTGGSGVSIHETNAMALARVLDHQLPRYHGANPGVRAARALGRVLLYAIPAVTGWERMRTDQHYAWNVLLGGGLSYYLTSATLRAHDHLAAAPRPETGAAAPPRWRPRLVFSPAPRGTRGGALLLGWDLSRPRIDAAALPAGR